MMSGNRVRLRECWGVDPREKHAQYDWPTDTYAEAHDVHPAGVVLIEGVGVCRNELPGQYDLRIWLECSRDERLRRGIGRDGKSSRALWEWDWMPSEDRYVAEHAPHTKVDLVVSGEAS